MRIGFIGYGEAARAFRASLAAADPAIRFSAFDIAPGAVATMAPDGVTEVDPPGLGEADWIFSAVTADQSLLAAESLAPHLRRGQLYLDINSVSPGRKETAAALVGRAGVAYLDMAVMAPVHPKGHRTPVLVAGAISAARDDLDRLGFDWTPAGPEAEGRPGQATAIKMVRSLFVKGLEAITVEALLAAQVAGCLPQILHSLSTSFPGLGWPGHAAYSFERTLRHGRRRAAEMRESAATIGELGLNGRLAAEVAAIQERMGAAPLDAPPPGSLEDGIAALLDTMKGKDGWPA